MRLGLFTAAFAGRPREEVVATAVRLGCASLEVAAWPPGAGAAHVDATDPADVEALRRACDAAGLAVSALSCYGNPLAPDGGEAIRRHLERLVDAAAGIGVAVVGAYVGRDPSRTVRADLEAAAPFLADLAERGRDRGVAIAIENCPMPVWHPDRYPGNLAYSPELWCWFRELGCQLNFDPSHLPPLGIDPVLAVRDHGGMIAHVQAKDVATSRDRRQRYGYPGPVLERDAPDDEGWWRYRTPGLGEIDWAGVTAALAAAGFGGDVAIEHEDDRYEGGPERVEAGLTIAVTELAPLLDRSGVYGADPTPTRPDR